MRQILRALLVLAVLSVVAVPSAANATMLDIVPRAQWDPNGQCRPTDHMPVVGEVAALVVHHTAKWRHYAPQDGPAVMRKLCELHQKRGFSDIGYHFAVDRYGRVYEGRAGSLAQPREGAHAQGVNHATVGVVLIGDFHEDDVPAAATEALTQVLTWLVDRHGLDPAGLATVRSTGGPLTKYRAGEDAVLPVIVGHRGSGDTLCPGKHLGDHLPGVRAGVAARLRAGSVEVDNERVQASAVGPEKKTDSVMGRIISGLGNVGAAFAPGS